MPGFKIQLKYNALGAGAGKLMERNPPILLLPPPLKPSLNPVSLETIWAVTSVLLLPPLTSKHEPCEAIERWSRRHTLSRPARQSSASKS